MRSFGLIRHRHRGVTLLEVLVSAVLLSTGVVVISQTISGSISAGTRADRLSTAGRLASDVMARIESGELSALESESGDFSEDGEPDFFFETQTQAVHEAGLREVLVEIVWEEPAGIRSLELSRYIFVAEELEIEEESEEEGS